MVLSGCIILHAAEIKTSPDDLHFVYYQQAQYINHAEEIKDPKSSELYDRIKSHYRFGSLYLACQAAWRKY